MNEKNMADVADKAIGKVDSLLSAISTQIIDIGNKYGPQAYETMLNVIRVDGIGNLLIGLTCLAYTVYYMVNIQKWHDRAEQNENVYKAIITFGSAAVFFAAIVAFGTLLDVWVWAKVFSPELYLTHAAVEKLIK